MSDDERRLRAWVSVTLTVGMAIAIGVIAIGMALALVSGRGLGIGSTWIAGLTKAEPGSIVLLGVLLLTLTPVAQLTAAAVAFGRAGEHRYLTIALVVLGLLLGSLAIAIGIGRT